MRRLLTYTKNFPKHDQMREPNLTASCIELSRALSQKNFLGCDDIALAIEDDTLSIY